VAGRDTVIQQPRNRGKGHAVRSGVAAARGRRVLVTDADLSCPIDEHARLDAAMDAGRFDVAIGSRGLPDSRVEVRQRLGREYMGRTFNVIVRALTPLPFADTQCGFKLMDAGRLRPIFRRLVVDGFAWDVELLLACARHGLRVAEVPVVWRNSPDSRVGLIGDPLRMLVDLGRILRADRRHR
jgi:dolichyl-phosphate beta-glucosyltransferase